MKRCPILLLLLIATLSAFSQITGVNSNSKFFVDANGNRVGKGDYDVVYWYDDAKHGSYEYFTNYLEGVVNQYGKEVIAPLFDHVICTKALIIVENKKPRELKGAYNYNYKEVYKIEYDDIECYNFGPGYVMLKKNGKWGGGDLNGNIQIPIQYDYLTWSWTEQERKFSVQVSNGGRYDYYRYLDGKTWGLYVNGKLAVPCEYDTIMDASEDNIYMIKKNGKWGYYGDGRELIAPKYDAVTGFSNGVATVRKDGEVSMIKNPLRNADDIKIASGGPAINNKKERGPVKSRYPTPDSDVDKNIPTAKKQAEMMFAFIICNENYPDAPVPYSLNDGRMFREYCQKTLGIPEKNINLYEDATFGNIITAVEKMKSIADAYDGEASVIFYYSGHGFPDDKQSTAYLLPIDGDASSITTTGYSLAKLYKEIASLKLKSSVVFLDACFSGAKREDEMLASSRGVAIKVKEEAPQGNMIVFSAAQGDETAHQLEEKHHGLFTYCLLKELQKAQGDINLGTLTDNVTKQVKRQSVVINNKKQTPTVIPSQKMMNDWREMKLK